MQGTGGRYDHIVFAARDGAMFTSSDYVDGANHYVTGHNNTGDLRIWKLCTDGGNFETPGTTTSTTTTTTTAAPTWKSLGLSVLSDTTSSNTITQAEANNFATDNTANHFQYNYVHNGSGSMPAVGDRIQFASNGNPVGNPNTGSNNLMKRIWVNNAAGPVVLINNVHYSQPNSGEILHILYPQ